MTGEFRTYLLAHIPNWTLVGVVIAVYQGVTDMPGWLAVALVVLWLAKDLLLFPRMRRYYRSEPADRLMVGQAGMAVTRIAPDGLVRVGSELWQARSEQPIAEGARVHVRDIEGLRLLVSAEL